MSRRDKIKEPLIRIAKRDPLPFWKSWGIRIIAFLLSMLVYFWAVFFFTGKTPVDVVHALLNSTIGLAEKQVDVPPFSLSDTDAKAGDVNGDTRINKADATYILKSSAGAVTLEKDKEERADSNHDNKVNAADAALLLKYVAGTETETVWAIKDITLWKNIRDIMFLFGVALALAPAFKMRFWNIGAEGQIIMGGIATAIIMRNLAPAIGHDAITLAIMAVAASIAGALWSAIPAIFNATHKTNETLFTLMMNYIAMQLAVFLNVLWENPKGSGTMGTINSVGEAGYLPQKFLSGIVGEDGYMLVVLFVIAIAVFIYFYLSKSKHGYEIAVIGDSQDTARYAGINVKKVIIRTVAISGAICGFMGFLIVSGADHTVSRTTAGGRGFTAIVVAWLGKMNVFYMLLVSAMLVALGNGAAELANTAGLDKALGDVLTGIVLFFILASELFVTCKLIFRHSKKEVM